MTTKPWILLLLVALSLCSLSCVCHLPVAKHTRTTNQTLSPRFDRSAELLTQKIAEVLPKGWSVQRSTNQITITRDERVRRAYESFYPGVFESRREYERHVLPDTFRITLAMDAKLSEHKHVEEERQREDISVKIQKQVALLQSHGDIIMQMGDNYVALTDEGQGLVDEYKKLRSSLHKLPNFFFGECSIYYQDWPWGLTIEPDAVRSECF